MFGFARRKDKVRGYGSSRRQIAIKQVKDGVLELPGGEFRMVLEVTPVNFELRSEEEQDSIIDTYEGFLNSISHPLQILVRTREVDMDEYLAGIEVRREEESEGVYREQLTNYQEFVRSLVSSNKILTRRFYLILPHSRDGREDFEVVREQLLLSSDIVAKGLARVGMSSRVLSSLEVLDLFYSFYSPERSKVQPLVNQAVELVGESLLTSTSPLELKEVSI